MFLGIILAFNKRSPIEIAEAIKNFDLELISIELVQHLIQYMPNDTEVGYLMTHFYGDFDISEILLTNFHQNHS